MKRFIASVATTAVFSIACGSLAQDAASPISIAVLGRTHDAAGRPVVSVKVANTATKPYYFYYHAWIPKGEGWTRARYQGGSGNGPGSSHLLGAGATANLTVHVPPGEKRWKVRIRYKPSDGSEREAYTGTPDILEE